MVKLDVIIILLIGVTLINCRIELILERANVTEFNPRYITFARIYVSRLSRKSPYFGNLEGQIKQMWTNNVSFHLYFYEYLHNEYRRTFVEMHEKYCDFLQKDVLLGKMFANTGLVSCPLPAGTYRLLNLTVPINNLKFEIPLNKFQVLVELFQTEAKEIIAKGYINAHIQGKL